MSDINISVGYIGADIIALCSDYDADYSFYAKYVKGEFLTKMQSSHGLVTTGRFKELTNARQMVLIALSKHLEVLDQGKKIQDAEDDLSVVSSALH